jgi:DNA invertase Pin-like site-specific DNA recombinase
MFQITGAFAEFERSMIRTRVNAGLKRAKDQIKQKGHFVTKHGEVRKRLGRPNADPDKLRKARAELAKGIGINRVAKMVGLGVGTVQKLKNEMVEARNVALEQSPTFFVGFAPGRAFDLRGCASIGVFPG